MILSKKNDLSGTSLIEATIAACTSAIFLGSLFSMNLTAMKTIRTAREASSASQVLQQRVESMRIANWQQVTNVNWLTSNQLLGSSAAGSEGLNVMKETLRLEPYGSGGGNTQIERSGSTTTIVSRNDALLTESAMKVIWTVDYSGGINSRPTTRQTVAILAKGGVARW